MMLERVASLAQGLSPRERKPTALGHSTVALTTRSAGVKGLQWRKAADVPRRSPLLMASGGMPAHHCDPRSGSRRRASRPTPLCAPRTVLYGFLLAAAACLTACKTTPRATGPAPSGPWETRRTALQQNDHFDLTGRIAVAAAQEGFNAKLRWKQQGEHSNLSLDGPLGVGGVRITADGRALKVIDSRGRQLDSDAARDEMNAKLGFEPPIASLRYWVLGVPDPTHPAEEVLDADQRLATLRQDGWQIDYTEYATVAGQWRPSKLTLKRDDVRVRLLVDGWGS